MEAITHCSWCNRDLGQTKYSHNDLAKGICLKCVEDMNILPHHDLTRYFTDDWVDDLAYGTIVIDENDVILKYNRAESRTSKLSPESVEGKNFFIDVAPCTAVKEFQGVLQELRASESDGQESIKFTFNHRNFHAYVSILMTYFNEPGITVLSIKKMEEKEEN